MAESREALVLVSPEERRRKIAVALKARNAETHTGDFREKLFKNMAEKGAARKERQEDASAASPLAAGYPQPWF